MEKEIRKSTGLADQATKRLRDFIVNEKYQPGDLLPGEIELSQKLGVSRTIIREALSRFRMMGIVESRRRRGMILTSPDILSGFELAIDGTWLEADTQRELFELRLMMEIGLSDL
ncbi:MAG: FadR family transcriptional regulator, partial [Bacteroidetes bacterium]|nr:FadR family transcriptional regulator [Bacteroidota bacterium]